MDMQKTHIIDKINQGILELGLAHDEHKVNQLVSYLELLFKWNKVFSLTAVTNYAEAITTHILDGLSIVNHLSDSTIKSVIDIGSGMGVPGIILAIWCEQLSVSLLDCNHKKIAFLTQAVIELGLNNATVINHRVESYAATQNFDVIISRAFSDSGLFVNLSKHLLKTDGFLLLMKSQAVFNELDKISGCSYELIPVTIPFVNNQRFLLKIRLNG